MSTISEALNAGHTRIDAGDFDGAESVFADLVREFPEHPGGYVGLAQTAMRRRQWQHALERWSEVQVRFNGLSNPSWLQALAITMFELGHREEGEAMLAGCLKAHPEHPAAYVGMAQLALWQRNWASALVHCDLLLARFPNDASATRWRTLRAAALLESGRFSEAEACLAEIPNAAASLTPLTLLIRLYVSTGRLQMASETLEASPLAIIESAPILAQRLNLMIRLGRVGQARDLFTSALAGPLKVDIAESLLEFVPMLFEPVDRASIWTRLLQVSAEPCVLRARIQLALRDRAAFLDEMRRLPLENSAAEMHQTLGHIQAVVSHSAFPDYSKPKIFGIGLSRTGTTTLATALTLLGYNTVHWSNPVTCEVISIDDAPLFDALTDTPVILLLPLLYDRFPNARFVLTKRPVDQWIASMSRLWRSQFGIDSFEQMKHAISSGKLYAEAEYRHVNWSLYFRFDNLWQAYESHHRDIREYFLDKPACCFLELDLFQGDGWPELCTFLGKDVPSEAFPWENRLPA